MRYRAVMAGLLLVAAACADNDPTVAPLSRQPTTAHVSDALDAGLYWRDPDTLWVYDRKPEGGAGTHYIDGTAISQLQNLNTRLTRVTLSIPSYQSGGKDAFMAGVANMCAAGLKPVVVVHAQGWSSWTGFPSFMHQAVAENPCVQHWQLWNEPDQAEGTCKPESCAFGMGTPYQKGQDYAAMLIQTYPQVKSANPNALVLTAGVNFGTGYPFLQGMYAGGARKYFDILALHPYGGATAQWDHPNYSCPGVTGAGVRTYGLCLQNLAAANGDAGRMLWASEFGVSAQLIWDSWHEEKYSWEYDGLHAQWWVDALTIASNYRYYQAMIGYQLVATEEGRMPINGGNPDDYGFGIIRPNGTLRTAAAWLQSSGYNTHALNYPTAAGDVTVYSPSKRPVNHTHYRSGPYIVLQNVVVTKLSRTVIPFESEPAQSFGVSITGNDEIGPGYGCSWSAVPQGGVGPFTYEWKVNGIPQGGNSEYLNYTNDGNNFSITVSVYDSQGGQGNGQKGVYITPGYYCM